MMEGINLMKQFYEQTKDEVLKQLSVNENTGLTDEQVKQSRENMVRTSYLKKRMILIGKFF